jgi:hypothetical protein
MLSVCGNKDDVPLLEEMIVSDYGAKQPFVEELVRTGLALGGPIGMPAWIELVKLDERRKKLGLDALVACYLTLRGPDGLDLIDKQFLKNPQAEYTYIYSTVMALRFHADENTGILPRERLLSSMRLLLDNPDFSDQIPIDLARWNDWSVLDRLVAMYKASEKTAYIRPPVVSYLLVASDQPGDVGVRAKAALAELEKLDPEGVEQARNLAAFGALARARASAPTTTQTAEISVTAADNESSAGNVASSSDEAQGFGASAADVQAAAETNPAELPEPLEFEGSNAATDGKPQAAVVPEDDARAVKDKTETPAKDNPASDVTAPPDEAKPSPVVAHTVSPDLQPPAAESWIAPFAVGIPLVAGVLLMGLYWIILRFGAV